MNCKLYDFDYSHFENISCPNQDWNKRWFICLVE
jgi:hypothetical protein